MEDFIMWLAFVIARNDSDDTCTDSHSATLRGLCAFGAVPVSNLLIKLGIASSGRTPPRNDMMNDIISICT